MFEFEAQRILSLNHKINHVDMERGKKVQKTVHMFYAEVVVIDQIYAILVTLAVI